MFYKITMNNKIRVDPTLFDDDVQSAVRDSLKKEYTGFISQDIGFVIDVGNVTRVGEGMIVPEDSGAYYDCDYELICFKPVLKEVVWGKIRDIADFGAFMTIGPVDGMIHVSQTMDDFVSFSKEKTLAGRDSKRVLKVGDKCKARIIAVSYKDLSNPKIGITMRQEGLGKLEWIYQKEDKKKSEKKKDKK